jgi:uncharacterized protein YndB with AHSA1/START domain
MIDALGGRRTDSATRVIAAPPEAIYRAFLDPEAWVKWLPPEGMTGRIYQFEPRPGGSYRMALTYRKVDPATRGKTSEGTDMVLGRFLELVPDKQVVHLVTFDSGDPIFAGEMKMRWHLSPLPGGTKVTITCENVPPGIRQEDHDAGLQSTLKNLAKFVETSSHAVEEYT